MCFKTTHIRVLVVMLLGMAFAKGLINTWSNPPWQAADEPMHLETALKMGYFFRSFSLSDQQPKQNHEKKILTVMANHDFFRRINIPEPYPLSDSFDTTPFLRDAPSKHGRQPLYYLITGIPLAMFTSGILESLYLARLISLCFSLVSVLLLLRVIQIAVPQKPQIVLFATLFLTSHPAFWQIGVSVNPESWKMLLMTTGLMVSLYSIKYGINRKSAVYTILWLLTVSATSWTLLFPAFPMVVVPMIHHWNKSDQEKYPRFFKIMILAALFLVSAGVVFVLSHRYLLEHEARLALGGISNLVNGNLPYTLFIKTLTESFWLGFAWLTIPVPWCLTVFYRAATLLWSGLFLLFLCKNPGKKVFNRTLGYTIFLWMLMILVRASADDSAFQGRYLYPMLPLIVTSVALGLYQLKQSVLKTTVMIILLVIHLGGDAIAHPFVWLKHQHADYLSLKEPVKTLSKFAWIDSPGTTHSLDGRHPDAAGFFYSGWYPPEPGQPHRWMMNRSSIVLPMVYPQNALIHIRVHPFSVPRNPAKDIQMFLNGHFIGARRVQPGWNTYTFPVQKPFFRNDNYNLLVLEAREALSPVDFEISGDTRFLSIAVKQILITPMTKVTSLTQQDSGWNLSPESDVFLHFNPGDTIELMEAYPGDYIFSILDDGEKHYFPAVETHRFYVDSSSRYTHLKYHAARNNQAVTFFKSLQNSVHALPGILSDVYFHLSLLLIWYTLLTTVFLFFLFFIL
jgi:hypothetical protein